MKGTSGNNSPLFIHSINSRISQVPVITVVYLWGKTTMEGRTKPTKSTILRIFCLIGIIWHSSFLSCWTGWIGQSVEFVVRKRKWIKQADDDMMKEKRTEKCHFGVNYKINNIYCLFIYFYFELKNWIELLKVTLRLFLKLFAVICLWMKIRCLIHDLQEAQSFFQDWKKT